MTLWLKENAFLIFWESIYWHYLLFSLISFISFLSLLLSPLCNHDIVHAGTVIIMFQKKGNGERNLHHFDVCITVDLLCLICDFTHKWHGFVLFQFFFFIIPTGTTRACCAKLLPVTCALQDLTCVWTLQSTFDFFFCVAVKVSKCHSGHLRQSLIMLTPEDDGDSVGVDDSDAPRRRMTDLFWLWGETSIQSTLKQMCVEKIGCKSKLFCKPIMHLHVYTSYLPSSLPFLKYVSFYFNITKDH